MEGIRMNEEAMVLTCTCTQYTIIRADDGQGSVYSGLGALDKTWYGILEHARKFVLV